MKKRKPKLNNELCDLLLDRDFHKFKLLELRNEYESRYGLVDFQNRSELRKWLYRPILLLVKNGYLTKSKEMSERSATYYVTDHFKNEFKPKKSELHTNIVSTTSNSPNTNSLISKQNQYQVDMLAFAGECKEYQQLVSDYPHLREQIEPMYHHARERSSELLGQLRAVENLINHMDLPE